MEYALLLSKIEYVVKNQKLPVFTHPTDMVQRDVVGRYAPDLAEEYDSRPLAGSA